MFTVKQVREDVAPFALEAGRCKDDSIVLKYINDARRLLWNRGNFVGLMDTLRVRAECGQVTLPYGYMKATDAKVCGDSIQIENEWFETADNVKFGSDSCWGSMIDLGIKFASFMDYEHGNHRLAIRGEMIEDKGKLINFQCIGEHGNIVTLNGTIGEDHEFIKFNPWIKYFRMANKDKTVGRVRVYIFDPNRGIQAVCAIYESDEINPMYRRYRTPGARNGYFYLRCKRSYRELQREEDRVEFGTDSLIQACIGLNARRKSDSAGFVQAMNLAVESENQILKDDKPIAGGRIRLSRHNKVTNLGFEDSYVSGTNYYRRFP